MGLPEILREKQEALADRWRELVLMSYPPQAVAFLRQEKDGFRNPVGATIRQAIDELTGALVTGAGREDSAAAVDALVRMRAVQNFSPGQAVGFVFLFRRALADVLGEELAGVRAEELIGLDARVDGMALEAWDRYAASRDKVSELRAREATARTYALLKRAGLIVDDSGTTGVAASSGAEGRS
ncbi:MAG: RsbRD N-terminal domain-containing protein [Acidithiobacillales bacterium]